VVVVLRWTNVEDPIDIFVPAWPGADGVVQTGGARGRSRILGPKAGFPEAVVILGTRLQLQQGVRANLQWERRWCKRVHLLLVGQERVLQWQLQLVRS
jgi:hypothetical protein